MTTLVYRWFWYVTSPPYTRDLFLDAACVHATQLVPYKKIWGEWMSISGVYMTVLVCRWKTLKSWKVAKVGNPVRRVLFEQSQRAQLKSVWTSEWSPCLKAKSGYFVAALCFAMERRLELVLIVWRTSVITRKPILSFNRSSNFSKPPILFAAG